MPDDITNAPQGTTEGAPVVTEAKPAEGTPNQEATTTTETKPPEQTGQQTEQNQAQQEAPAIDAGAFVLPEGVQMDTKALEAFLPIAQEAGINQAQAQKFLDLYVSLQSQQVQAKAAEFDAGVTAIKTAWGTDYEQNMGKVEALLGEYGGEEAISQARQSIYADQKLAAALLKIATAANPHRLVGGYAKPSDVPTKDLLFAESLKT